MARQSIDCKESNHLQPLTEPSTTEQSQNINPAFYPHPPSTAGGPLKATSIANITGGFLRS